MLIILYATALAVAFTDCSAEGIACESMKSIKTKKCSPVLELKWHFGFFVIFTYL